MDCGCVGVLVEVGMVSVGGVVLVEVGGMERTEVALG